MAPDIGDGCGQAGFSLVEPPVVISGMQEPVLRVGAVSQVDIPDLASLDESASVLHERVATIVEVAGVDEGGCFSTLQQHQGLI